MKKKQCASFLKHDRLAARLSCLCLFLSCFFVFAEGLLFEQNFTQGVTADYAAGQRAGKPATALTMDTGLDGAGIQIGIWDNALHNLRYSAAKNINLEAGSVELWIKPLDWTGSDEKFHYFFEAGSKDSRLIIYKYWKNSDLYFVFGPTPAAGEKTPPWTIASINVRHWLPGQWHYLVCSWDRHEIKLYVDGGGVSKSIRNLPVTPFEYFTIGPLHKYQNAEGKTMIDKVKIHQQPIEENQIQQQWEQHKTVNSKATNPADFWILDNRLSRFLIARSRGNLAEGWNLASQDQYIVESFDEYILKNQLDTEEKLATEKDDQVIDILQEQLDDSAKTKSVRIRCQNSVSGLEIIKTYELGPDESKLAKRVEFSITPDKGGLLQYASGLNFSPSFRKGYYHVRNERDSGAPFLTKAEEVTYRRKMDGLRGMSQICFVNTQKQFGVGHYKYLLNQLYDLKYGLGISDFTPEGWVIAIGGDFIGYGNPFSAEVHYTIFPGDHVQFHLDYQNLPAYRAINAYPRPDWLKDVRLVAGWKEVEEIGSGIDPEAFINLFEKDEPVFGYVLSPWNDPMWAYYGDFLDGEIELFPKEGQSRLANLQKVQELCPRLKLSCYTWHSSVGPKSQIFTRYPQWLVYNEQDQPQCLAPQIKAYKLNSIYRQMVSNPDYVQYACDRVKRVLTELGYDIYYTDDMSLTRVSADWKTRTAIHNYHWLDYWKKIREAVKSCGEDKIYFANSYLPDISGPDCGLIEFGSRYPWIDPTELSRSGRKRWTAWADRIFLCKLYQRDSSGWIAPVFWGHWSLQNARNNDPYYPNYLIGFGLKPMSAGEADARFMGSTFNSLLSKMPYIDAAYETRGLRVVNANLSPCWWQDEGNIEAYSLKQGNDFFIPVISHEAENTTVNLKANTAKAELEANAETYFWVFDMKDPAQFTREEMLASDWRQKNIMSRTFLKKVSSPGDTLELSITTRPSLLSLVMITQVPAFISAVNGKNSQMLLSSTEDVQIQGKLHEPSQTFSLDIHSRKDSAEIMAFFPAEWGQPQILAETRLLTGRQNLAVGPAFYHFNVSQGKTKVILKRQ